MSLVKKNNKISQEALEAFLHVCHVRSYPAKLTIVRPGDVGDKLLFVVDGSVSVSVEDEEGHELILAYLNKHDFVGEIGDRDLENPLEQLGPPQPGLPAA